MTTVLFMDSQNRGFNSPPGVPGRSPWLVTGVTAVVAGGLVVGLLSMSGNSGTPTGPMGAKPTMPTLPDLGGTKGTGGKSPAAGAPGKPTGKNDWNSATGDKTVFTAETWFPPTGAQTVESRSYQHLVRRNGSCMAAEPEMRTLMTGTCVKVIQSVWANPGKTHVGALSVVSLTDKPAATALQDKLSDDRSKGQYINFLTPPSSSGVKVPRTGPSWVGTTVSGHYMVIAEVMRVDGAEKDATSREMVNDLTSVAMDYIKEVSTA
ncbi:hypothetical protein [Yinghuangia sp. YIM S09857]|uniref:hypothetical protein n=1 Tax=Yinghuangia sp. YIM S09857 TaxID=3436929 RepID=UPI003F539A79